jgi:hypothetical protein
LMAFEIGEAVSVGGSNLPRRPPVVQVLHDT